MRERVCVREREEEGGGGGGGGLGQPLQGIDGSQMRFIRLDWRWFRMHPCSIIAVSSDISQLLSYERTVFR